MESQSTVSIIVSWLPFLVMLGLSLYFLKFGISVNKDRAAQTRELIDINRKSLEKLGEIKSLLEDRKS